MATGSPATSAICTKPGSTSQRTSWPSCLELGLGERHEAPVAGPGIVEDVAQDGDVAVQVLEVERPQRDLVALAVQHALRRRRELKIRIDDVGQQILGLGIALLLDARPVVRQGMAHHHHRRGVEAVHQQPAFLVDGQVERPAHLGHALAAQPVFGGAQQGREHRRVVAGLQQPEITDPLAVRLLVQRVHLRADAADHLVTAPRQPGLPAGVLEQRIAGRQQLMPLQQQRRHPVRIVPVQTLWQRPESTPGRPPHQGRDGQRRRAVHAHSRREANRRKRIIDHLAGKESAAQPAARFFAHMLDTLYSAAILRL